MIDACWTCLAQRLRANRDVERYVTARHGDDDGHVPRPPPLGVVPAITADAAATLIALEITKVVAGAPTNVDDQLVTLDWVSLERVAHTVVRRPQCPSCGTPPPATGPTGARR